MELGYTRGFLVLILLLRGYFVGRFDGYVDGYFVGRFVILTVGDPEGFPVGNILGYLVGYLDGYFVGRFVGNTVGCVEGFSVGSRVGYFVRFVGNFVLGVFGNLVGFLVGSIVGATVGATQSPLLQTLVEEHCAPSGKKETNLFWDFKLALHSSLNTHGWVHPEFKDGQDSNFHRLQIL